MQIKMTTHKDTNIRYSIKACLSLTFMFERKEVLEGNFVEVGFLQGALFTFTTILFHPTFFHSNLSC